MHYINNEVKEAVDKYIQLVKQSTEVRHVITLKRIEHVVERVIKATSTSWCGNYKVQAWNINDSGCVFVFIYLTRECDTERIEFDAKFLYDEEALKEFEASHKFTT